MHLGHMSNGYFILKSWLFSNFAHMFIKMSIKYLRICSIVMSGLKIVSFWVFWVFYFIGIEFFFSEWVFFFHKEYMHIFFDLIQSLYVITKSFQAWIVIFCTVRSANIAYFCTNWKKFVWRTCSWTLIERLVSKSAFGCGFCEHMWVFFFFL